MAVLTTIGSKEDFIVQMNGDYNVAFDELSVAVAGNSGDVIAVGSKFGILAETKDATAKIVRVLVRGNPTTVNFKALNFKALNVATTITALASQGIIVVNN